jgi:hypothetical protein
MTPTTNTNNTSNDDNNNNDDVLIRKVFDLFDRNHNGYITIHDLRIIANELGEISTLSNNDLYDMILCATNTTTNTITTTNNSITMTDHNNTIHNTNDNIRNHKHTNNNNNTKQHEQGLVVTYEQFANIMNRPLFS